MAECDTCGAVADTLYLGSFPSCFRCEEHARESAEELNRAYQEEIGDSWCHDCGAEKATCIFLHLDGRRFYLCGWCFAAADHEPDYLMFCECRNPDMDDYSDYCHQCSLKVPAQYFEEQYADGPSFDYLEDEDEAVTYCGCPVPCLEFKGDKVCFFCKGQV